MKEELEDNIIKKYPRFFKSLNKNTGFVIPIQFGFECGDGWYELLDALLQSMEWYIKSKEDYPQKQLKSKFWRTVFKWLNHKFRFKKFGKKIKKLERKFKTETIPPPTVDVVQIKEKYGELRFYIHGGDDFIDGMIDLAETLSLRTCETCGSTKNIGHTQGWISTMCKECFDKGEHGFKKWKPKEI